MIRGEPAVRITLRIEKNRDDIMVFFDNVSDTQDVRGCALVFHRFFPKEHGSATLGQQTVWRYRLNNVGCSKYVRNSF